MKVMKRIFAAAAALIMACTMYIPVFAANDNNTLTIHSKTDGHTYQAYQVFDGDYYEGVLSNIEWGTGVKNTDALLNELTTGSLSEYFSGAESAEDIAKVLGAKDSPFTDNSELLDDLADIIGSEEYLSDTYQASGAPTGNDGAYTYQISGLADGWYFVKEDTLTDTENNAYTKFMLRVVNDTEVDAKADVPPIDKKIDGATDTDPGTSGDVTANNASIGDKIPYKVTSTVPNMDGYEKYYFVVTDTLSEGLTFNSDVAVAIGGTTLGNDDYTVETAESGEQTVVTIVFNNFLQYKEQAGDAILITYTATLNEDAVIGTAGNPNSVDLIYSNNPNVEDDGTPGNPNKPDEDSPVGHTPDKVTYTYVTGVRLTKVNTDSMRLDGAEFKISGTRLNTTVVYRDVYTEDAAGTYWKLKDGTYTTEAPNTDPDTGNGDQYESTDTKYRLEEQKETVQSSEQVAEIGYVGSDGILRFDGLAAGEYAITEITAPDGYNLLDSPINITIGWTEPAVPGQPCTWTVEGGNASVENGIVLITVENEAGSLLPETGGIGTVIFYVVGGGLMVTAAVLLIVRRRMSGKEQ